MTLSLVKRVALAGCGSMALVAMTTTADAARTDYIATVDVVPGTEGAAADTVTGLVFEDLSRDGIRQDDEPGIAGVMVSNSREVVLTDAYISERHATITLKRTGEKSGDFKIVDLDSTNGTFHNSEDEQITAEELVDNDVIIFGKTRCKFKCVG